MIARRIVPALAALALVLLLGACAGGATKTTADATTVEGQIAQPGSSAGDAAKGKLLFASNSCGGCHTFGPAGTNGTAGPDLDNLAADADKAGRGALAEYVHESIVNPDAYHAPGFTSGGMPSFSGQLSEAELADLVAFLTTS